MKLWLVRHAQPLVEGGVCYGASDVACDPQTLQTAAANLLQVLPKNLPIISSPLQRCEQLAQILCGLQPDLTYKTDANLAEMHFGNWEMRPWSEIDPQELAAWTDDFAHYRCGDSGESTAQVIQRVVARLVHSCSSGQDQIWITHAGVMRALMWLGQQSAFGPWLQSVISAQAQNLIAARADFIAAQAQGFPQVPQDLLCQLRAADWPQHALAWCQVQTWHWETA